MKHSIRTKLFWGHIALFLVTSTVSILITWMEFEMEGTVRNIAVAHWRPVLVAAGISCVPVLLLAVASWWFTRRCLAPIVTLTNAAERIREDNLHESIPLSGSDDELDRLALVLNDMMRHLDGAFQQIREFTLHASHELKTPLTILMAGFEKALLDHDLSEEQRNRLLNWLGELERLNRIVSGLTLLTQGDAHQVELNLETLDLGELAADSASEAAILGQSLNLNIVVNTETSCLVRADRHRLRQLLLNITDNAVKYNREGGSVEYHVFREDGQACVEIRSTGRGIDAEELPHIFDRFFRSSTSRGTVSDGCGLGLSIAKWIAEEHGGSLTARSAPDNTVLSLRLPLRAPDRAVMPPVPGKDKSPALLALGAWLACFSIPSSATETKLTFNHDVRPILAAKCFSCHGPDEDNRKGKLRLDERAAALERQVIIPGDPESSTLIQRILSHAEDEVMPPPDKHEPLSTEEAAVLSLWIHQGAVYERHWAFTTAETPAVPDIDGAQLSPIDAFILARIRQQDLEPSPPAMPEDWLRRVSFVLTGLPPTPEEIDAFLADSSMEAKVRVVERLLDSPHFGEQMAVPWLDAARYADTFGRHEDADSNVWPWRDWVIQAFNTNMPYDEFLRWQMAGDLLPEASQAQRVATAFHRLAVQSNESGSDPDEFRWDQIFDRDNTTASAVLGLTLECARCHDHKYDPFTRRDYFQLAAYFDKIDELGLFSRYTNGTPAPSTFVYPQGEEAEHSALKAAVARAEQAWQQARQEAPHRFTAWLQRRSPPGCGTGLWQEWGNPSGSVPAEALPARPELHLSFDWIDPEKRRYRIDNAPEQLLEGSISFKTGRPGRFGKSSVFTSANPKKYSVPSAFADFDRWQAFTFSLWLRTEPLPERAVILHRSRAGLDAANRGYELTLEDGRLTATLANYYPGNAIRIQAEEQIEFSGWRHLALTYDGSSRAAGLALYVDGKRLASKIVRDHLYRGIKYRVEWGDLDNAVVADADSANPVSLKIGGRTLDAGLRDAWVDELRVYNTQLCAAEIAWLATGAAAAGDVSWIDWFIREQDTECRESFAALTAARRAEAEFADGLPELMVMDESHAPQRQTTMLARGDFRQPGEPVEPGVPSLLLPLAENAPKDRRSLAEWLTDPRHPLTSRVQVNRIWTQFFGRGLVTTPQDFGTQGAPPSHPELLDWLAAHFITSGWDIKALCREIALSQTFGRSSHAANKETSTADPENVLLVRGPQFRLAAEQLRDAALAASGLLSRKIGGPSVKPYQPAGLWEDSGTQHRYEREHGEALHRRSLYTFWRRTCPPPVMSLFDAPSREFCTLQRQETITPQQALALMNDTGFLEAARVLSEMLVRAHCEASQDSARVVDAFRRLTGRAPSRAQMDTMSALIEDARRYYQEHPAAARDLLAASGETALDPALPPEEVAATLVMTRALLGSDGFVLAR